MSDVKDILAKAWKLRNGKKYNEALVLIDQARDVVKGGDHENIGNIFHVHAQILEDQKVLTYAFESRKYALAKFRKTGNELRIAHESRHIADLLVKMSQLEEAHLHYFHSLEVYRKLENPDSLNLANTLRSFALLLEKRNEKGKALGLWTEARDIYEKNGIEEGVEEANEQIARLS